MYVDTSVIVALIANEPGRAAVSRWYASTRAELVSAIWCVPEFGSALGIKQRTGQLDADQAKAAWARFEIWVANDLKLLPVELFDFQRAAALTLDAGSGLRAGDALHLACAERIGCKSMATLDAAMGRSALRLKIKPVAFV